MKNIYKKGRRKEYAVCDRLKTQGYDIVQRTAGSHSPLDIIAIDVSNRRIRLVQVKAGDFSASEKKKLLNENKLLNGEFLVTFELWN